MNQATNAVLCDILDALGGTVDHEVAVVCNPDTGTQWVYVYDITSGSAVLTTSADTGVACGVSIIGNDCDTPVPITACQPLEVTIVDDTTRVDVEYICDSDTDTFHAWTTVSVNGVPGAPTTEDTGVPCDPAADFETHVECRAGTRWVVLQSIDGDGVPTELTATDTGESCTGDVTIVNTCDDPVPVTICDPPAPVIEVDTEFVCDTDLGVFVAVQIVTTDGVPAAPTTTATTIPCVPEPAPVVTVDVEYVCNETSGVYDQYTITSVDGVPGAPAIVPTSIVCDQDPPVVAVDVEYVCNVGTGVYDQYVTTTTDGVAAPPVVTPTTVPCQDQLPPDVEETRVCDPATQTVHVISTAYPPTGAPTVIADIDTGEPCTLGESCDNPIHVTSCDEPDPCLYETWCDEDCNPFLVCIDKTTGQVTPIGIEENCETVTVYRGTYRCLTAPDNLVQLTFNGVRNDVPANWATLPPADRCAWFESVLPAGVTYDPATGQMESLAPFSMGGQVGRGLFAVAFAATIKTVCTGGPVGVLSPKNCFPSPPPQVDVEVECVDGSVHVLSYTDGALTSDVDLLVPCSDDTDIDVEEHCGPTGTIQAVVYVDGVETSATDTGRECPKGPPECVKWASNFVQVDNTGTHFSEGYTLEVENGDGTTTTIVDPGGHASWSAQLTAWAAMFQAAYPDCVIDARCTTGCGGLLPPPADAPPGPGIFARYVQFVCCPTSENVPVNIEITDSSNPKRIGRTLVYHAAQGPEYRGWICHDCAADGPPVLLDENMQPVPAADAPACWFLCSETIPAAPEPVCSFAPIGVFCEINPGDDSDPDVDIPPSIVTENVVLTQTTCGADVSIAGYTIDENGDPVDHELAPGNYYGDCDTLEPVIPTPPPCPEDATWNCVEFSGGFYGILDNSNWVGAPTPHLKNGNNYEFTFTHADGTTTVVQQSADPYFPNFKTEFEAAMPGCTVVFVCANHTSPKGCNPGHVANLAQYPAYDPPSAPGDIQNNIANPDVSELWATGWLLDCGGCTSPVVNAEITASTDPAWVGVNKDIITHTKPSVTAFQAVTCDGTFYRDCDGNDILAPLCCPKPCDPAADKLCDVTSTDPLPCAEDGVTETVVDGEGSWSISGDGTTMKVNGDVAEGLFAAVQSCLDSGVERVTVCGTGPAGDVEFAAVSADGVLIGSAVDSDPQVGEATSFIVKCPSPAGEPVSWLRTHDECVHGKLCELVDCIEGSKVECDDPCGTLYQVTVGRPSNTASWSWGPYSGASYGEFSAAVTAGGNSEFVLAPDLVSPGEGHYFCGPAVPVGDELIVDGVSQGVPVGFPNPNAPDPQQALATVGCLDDQILGKLCDIADSEQPTVPCLDCAVLPFSPGQVFESPIISLIDVGGAPVPIPGGPFSTIEDFAAALASEFGFTIDIDYAAGTFTACGSSLLVGYLLSDQTAVAAIGSEKKDGLLVCDPQSAQNTALLASLLEKQCETNDLLKALIDCMCCPDDEPACPGPTLTSANSTVGDGTGPDGWSFEPGGLTIPPIAGTDAVFPFGSQSAANPWGNVETTVTVNPDDLDEACTADPDNTIVQFELTFDHSVDGLGHRLHTWTTSAGAFTAGINNGESVSYPSANVAVGEGLPNVLTTVNVPRGLILEVPLADVLAGFSLSTGVLGGASANGLFDGLEIDEQITNVQLVITDILVAGESCCPGTEPPGVDPCLGDGTNCSTEGRVKYDLNPGSYSQATLDSASITIKLGAGCDPVILTEFGTLNVGTGDDGNPYVTNFVDAINALGGCFTAKPTGLDAEQTNQVLCLTVPAGGGNVSVQIDTGGSAATWNQMWDDTAGTWTGVDDTGFPVSGSATNC